MIRWSDHQTIRWSVFFIIIVGVFFLTEMFVFFALILQLHLDKPARLSFSCSLNLPLNILSNKCIKRLETALGCLTSPHFLRSDILSPSSLASLLLKKSLLLIWPAATRSMGSTHISRSVRRARVPGTRLTKHLIWTSFLKKIPSLSGVYDYSWCLSYGLSHGQQIWYRPSVIWKKNISSCLCPLFNWHLFWVAVNCSKMYTRENYRKTTTIAIASKLPQMLQVNWAAGDMGWWNTHIYAGQVMMICL